MHSFDTRPLILKFQEEDWKFYNICVSQSSPKADLETVFLNLEISIFWYFTFSQY